MFRNALYFVVIRFMDKPRPTERQTFIQFPVAVRWARSGPRALIYAVDEAKNDVCFERAKWPHYLEIWDEMNDPTQGDSQ